MGEHWSALALNPFSPISRPTSRLSLTLQCHRGEARGCRRGAPARTSGGADRLSPPGPGPSRQRRQRPPFCIAGRAGRAREAVRAMIQAGARPGGSRRSRGTRSGCATPCVAPALSRSSATCRTRPRPGQRSPHSVYPPSFLLCNDTRRQASPINSSPKPPAPFHLRPSSYFAVDDGGLTAGT